MRCSLSSSSTRSSRRHVAARGCLRRARIRVAGRSIDVCRYGHGSHHDHRTRADRPVAHGPRGAEAFGVGVRTILGESLTVEVWHPTEQDSTSESNGLRNFTPEIIRNLLADDADSVFTYAATRDALPVAGHVLGLVLFSHGFTGMRLQSTAITTHLASHGFVVVVPDHPSRDLFHVLGATASGDRDAPVDELLAAQALVLDEPELGPLVRAAFAAVGHSAGGGTVLSLAGRGEVDLLG